MPESAALASCISRLMDVLSAFSVITFVPQVSPYIDTSLLFKSVYYSTETPFRGPLKEISSSPCSHLTVSGGLSVFTTTQLMLTMLPTSTNKSGPPMMYEEGSETERGLSRSRMEMTTVTRGEQSRRKVLCGIDSLE